MGQKIKKDPAKRLEAFLDTYENKEDFLKLIERYLEKPPITRTFNDKAAKTTAELGWNLLVGLSTGIPMHKLEEILCDNKSDKTNSEIQEKMRQVIRTHPAFLSNRP